MKWIKFSWALAIGVFLLGALMGNSREITASYVTNGPKIDGKLDDVVWKNGVWFTDFSLISDSTKLAKVQTEFQIAYDDEFLYIAIRMDEPAPGCLKIDEFLRDGGICRDDSIEIMIDPYGDRYEYFHFITNAVGIKYDARRTHGGEFHDLLWDSNWKVATKIDSGEWTLEMAIPFAELSLNKKSEGTWSFNIARHRLGGKEEEFSSFSPMTGSFHVAQKFSKLYLPEAKLRKFFWGIKRPFDYHIESNKGDWRLTGKVQVTNEGSPNEQFQLLFKQVNKKGAMVLDVLTDTIPVGEEKEFMFSLPVEKQEPLEFQVEVVNIENAKEIYRVKKVPLDVDYKPLVLQLISPSYRNSIYSSENITELKMIVRLTLAPKVLRKGKLRVRLLNEKSDLVAEKVYEGLSDIQEVSLLIGDIVPGSYIIEAQVMEGEDIVAKSSQILKKLKHEEHEWRLDRNGALLYNGALFLPKGWIGMLPGEMQSINGSPYNALFMSKDVIEDEQEAKKYLDSVSKVKGHAVIYPYPAEEMMSSKQNLLRLLTGVEMQAIQQRVKSLMKHPALMAWIIAYEPEFNGISRERIKQVYSIISQEDPFHPTVIVNSSIGGIKEYLREADIAMPSTAITFISGKGATRRIDAVSYYLDVANKIANKSVPLWAGLQAYDYSNNWTESVRIPAFIELRNMFYQAIIGGVKGIFWNNYLYTYNYPGVRIGVEHLTKELGLLEGAVLAKEFENKVKVQSENSNVLYFASREVESDKYLFVVNTGDMVEHAVFDTPLFSGVKKLYVLSEKRVVEVEEDGIFRDYFEPYATHIYVTKALGMDLPSLDEIQSSIELANKARKKVGNLVFEDSGVRIRTSSIEDPSSITKLNDGVLEGIAWSTKEGDELPQWVEFSWVKPVLVSKVLVYSDTIESAKVQVREGGIWTDVADLKRRSGAHFRTTFKEREVEQMRILITERKPGANLVTLSEVEMFNNSTQEKDD